VCSLLFLFKFIGKLHMNLPFVVFKQTSCSKCAFSHKHISLHRLMSNIYIYLTLSFKELIEGRRYFEIRKNLYRIVSFSRSKIVVAIVILKYHSLALEIPLFGINTTPLSQSNCRILSNHVIILLILLERCNFLYKYSNLLQ